MNEKIMRSTRDIEGRIEDSELAHEMALAGGDDRRKAKLAREVGEALARDLVEGKIKGIKSASPTVLEEMVSDMNIKDNLYPHPNLLSKRPGSWAEKKNMRAQIKVDAERIAFVDGRAAFHKSIPAGTTYGKVDPDDYREASSLQEEKYLSQAGKAENKVEDRYMEGS